MLILKCKRCGFSNKAGALKCSKCKYNLEQKTPAVNSSYVDPAIAGEFNKIDDKSWLSRIRVRYGDAVHAKAKACIEKYSGRPDLARQDFIAITKKLTK